MKRLLFLLFNIPVISYAQSGCELPNAAMESSLFDALSKDLKIDTSTVDEMKAKVKILDVTPISRFYAEELAKIDYEEDKARNNNKPLLDEKSYFDSFYDNDVKSITAKYTYTNKAGKKSVFIATSLMNKDECSIRFNGYITLSREF
ncbi:Shiga toxin A subunit [Enterobacter cloacae]|uniref:Shiga toxin A subunit n=1 Tax=Enterobacter cloacae TaxID=550 RepID=A0A2T4Y1I7_ENTCL|nr:MULTISPECIES: Shiga toxin A subunit [Enterobacter]MBO4146399.1 Shiga toxin A subunit [Enterobacter ludwigii]HEO9143022.1 Shiga toxin A subunit [Enterobacter asburiae]MBM1019875.1 Shiga toxin A subunit [Enterobacter sp. E1]MEA3561175.1 Shiga toxin A subunit [Enterobacter sp. GM-22]MEA3595528.1 Shiga toxin A subunit [Enterobacter sp. GM-31]